MLYVNLYLYFLIFSIKLEKYSDERSKKVLVTLRYSMLLLLSAVFIRVNIPSHNSSEYIKLIFAMSPIFVLAAITMIIWSLFKSSFLIAHALRSVLRNARYVIELAALACLLSAAEFMKSYLLQLLIMGIIVILLLVEILQQSSTQKINSDSQADGEKNRTD